MSCEEMREILSAELDGEAADDELIGVYRHLAACPPCRNWRREILALKGAFARGEDHPLPRTVAKQLRRLERQVQTERKSGRHPFIASLARWPREYPVRSCSDGRYNRISFRSREQILFPFLLP